MATILVVYDRNPNREFLATLLASTGHRLVEARDGAEALERVRAERPDLIICDIAMPGRDGIEFVKHLRTDTAIAQTPVIFYTATDHLNEARLLAQSCGVLTVIAKPSRPQVILDAVSAALGAAAAPADRIAGARQCLPSSLTGIFSGGVDGSCLRLATLIELGLELAAERDPQRLLDLACGGAAAMFDARVTAIGMLGDSGERLRSFVVHGVSDALRALFGELDLSTALSAGAARRINDAAAASALLPSWHPPIGNLLIVPLKSTTRTFGWLYVADREMGGASFGEDDEQIAVILATQIAQAYENLLLYSETTAYAAQLEAEISERNRTQHLAGIGNWEWDLRTDTHTWSEEIYLIYGRAPGLPPAIFPEVQRYFTPDSWSHLASAMEQCLATGASFECDAEVVRSDGTHRWIIARGNASRGVDGNITGLNGTVQDITERKKAEDELRLAASVFDNTMDGIMVTDTSARIVLVNPAFTAITGYSAEEVVGRKPSMMSSEHTTQDFYVELWEELLREGRWAGEIWNRRKSGEAFLEWLTISMLPGADGKPLRYVGVLHDITELRSKDEHIRHLAFHDPLTGLPNRALLLDRLEHGIAFATRAKQRLGLMFIDLDRFKGVNDALGHDVGDGVLQEVARRLSQCVRQSDTVARMGGDEFVILLEHARDLADYASMARKAVAALAQPMAVKGHTIHGSASIGIACLPGDGADVFELIKNADAAMYAAKSAGRGTYRFFQPVMSAGAAQRFALQMELRNAVASGELELYYQPTVSLGGDAPFGVEALLRWRHPVRGLVLAADFIPLAEETGIIADLGDWVLDEACRQCSAWQTLGLGRIRIAVTIAAMQLQQGDLAERIASTTRRHGISPADLEIKLAESVILAARENIENLLGRLHEIGVAVAVDDYGSGASSLACLRRLPIDILSIDRSFVGMLDHSEEDEQFIRSILALGRALKLTVVAEGVETESQADFLRTCGCTVGQGYLYAHPAPAAQVEVWLRGHQGNCPGAAPH